MEGIRFSWEGEPAIPRHVYASEWLDVHHLSADARPHAVKMDRPVHTFLIYDEGSFSDGGRQIEGMRGISAPARDAGIDVLPARVGLAGWSSTKGRIGVSIVSVNQRMLHRLVVEDDGRTSGLRPELQLRGEILQPLATRIRRWSGTGWKGVEPLHAESVLNLMVREIVDVQQSTPATGTSRAAGMPFRSQRTIRDFVEANLGGKISLQDLADQVGMSRFHFSRAFKATFKLSPYRYVLNERVRKAAELLSGSDSPITEIALTVGFSCSNELSRSFRQSYDCAPREYRARTRGACMA